MRIYSYYCEFPLVEVHPKMCNSAVWIFTKFSEFPHAEIHCFRVNSLMRKSVLHHADIHEKRWISQSEEIQQTLIFRIWGFTLTIVYFHLWKCTQKCVYPLCGYTQFLPHAEIHSLMWISFTRKSVFPRTRICTFLSELPHVEIHKSMCKSAHGEIRFSTCGYSHKFVYFHMRRCTQNWEFSNTVHSNLNVVNTELLMEAQVILSISGDCSYTFIIWNTFILSV